MWKRTLGGVLFLVICIVGFYYMSTKFTDKDYSALNLIKSRMNAKNQLMDYDNEIGVRSVEDVGFKVKDDTIYLSYGNVQFELGKKELLDKDFMNGLKQIGIEIKRNRKGEYSLFYWGKKVQRWVS